ncbi:MAG: HPP family protein, partial [Eubacteriales bacterium]
GYAIGITLGVAFHLLAVFLDARFGWHFTYSVMGALAVGLALLLMTMTNAEHPPAAGLALGLVLQGFHLSSIAIIYGSVLILLFIKHLLRNWLINLY